MAFNNTYEISANEKQAIVNTVNEFRQNVSPQAKNMKMISWDNDFEKKLIELRDTKGPEWFFTKNTKYINPTIGYIFL